MLEAVFVAATDDDSIATASASFQECVAEEVRHMATMTFMGYQPPDASETNCRNEIRIVVEATMRNGGSREDASNRVAEMASEAFAFERARDEVEPSPRAEFVKSLDNAYELAHTCFTNGMIENPVSVEEDWGNLFAAYGDDCQVPAEQLRTTARYWLGGRGDQLVSMISMCASADVALEHGGDVAPRATSVCAGIRDQLRMRSEAP